MRTDGHDEVSPAFLRIGRIYSLRVHNNIIIIIIIIVMALHVFFGGEFNCRPLRICTVWDRGAR